MVLAGLVTGPFPEPDARHDERADDDREHDDRDREHEPVQIGDRTGKGTLRINWPRHAPPTLGQHFDACQSLA